MAKERKVMAVQLKVGEAKQRDVGKGRARLDVDTMEEISTLTKGYSGADLDAVCREAAILAMKRHESNGSISRGDFQEAIGKVRPSITTETVNWYESIYKQIRGIPRQLQFFG